MIFGRVIPLKEEYVNMVRDYHREALHRSADAKHDQTLVITVRQQNLVTLVRALDLKCYPSVRHCQASRGLCASGHIDARLGHQTAKK